MPYSLLIETVTIPLNKSSFKKLNLILLYKEVSSLYLIMKEFIKNAGSFTLMHYTVKLHLQRHHHHSR